MSQEHTITKIISNNILLEGMSKPGLEEIAARLKKLIFEENSTIYHQGDKATGLYFIHTGQIQIFTQREDEQIILSEASDNHLFGEFLLAGDSIRTTSARTQKKSVLYFLSIEDFHQLNEYFPEKMAQLGPKIINRLSWNETNLALRLSKLFIGLNDDIVRALINELDTRPIPANQQIIKQNEISQELLIVIHGRLQKRRIHDTDAPTIISVVGRGEAIGEKNVIGEYNSSTEILAIRDSLVASLKRSSFEQLLLRYPLEINQTLVKSIIRQSDDMAYHKAHSAETFAIIPLSDNFTLSELSHILAEQLNGYGVTSVIDSKRVNDSFHDKSVAQSTFADSQNDLLLQWLSAQENAHRHVIYNIDTTLTNWTRRCLRQTDHLLFIAKATDDSAISDFEQSIIDEISDKCAKKTLILIHSNDIKVPSNSSQWLEQRSVDMHHHVRVGNSSDFGRVARFLTGNAVGLVLGGGGARGFAHIGVIRALQELNIPIDLVGGNSMGAVIAAECAMQWDYNKMISNTKKLCIEGDEFTLPIVSLYSGRKITQSLKNLFSDVSIEDLWHRFYSVSCNISRATIMTHKNGSLFSAVLNSNTPPGLFPPQVSQGDLLVDGALLNNVPVDVMRNYNEDGIIIAVDVNTREDLLDNSENNGGMSGWKLLLNKLNPMVETIHYPNMIEILTRASMIGGLANRKKMMNGIADLYLQPPLNHFSLGAYKQGEKIAQAGYDYAIKELNKWKIQ
ncbi:MAG: cyclic nucleotide-binding domain-containing protein [Gammaproteobacteria bacterium]|nr:cyclic nucleotide-binding domain-containing protein [Gammaproteobacteria bacterium]